MMPSKRSLLDQLKLAIVMSVETPDSDLPTPHNCKSATHSR